MSKCYDNPDYDDSESDIQNTWNQFKPEKETFEDYLQRLKDRRTEDDYKYTDEDFIKYDAYIKDCCKSGMSVYKCLEFMYFAEKDMDDQLFNREPKQELKKNFYCGDEVDYDDKCLEQCDRCVDATGVNYGYLPKEKPKYPIGGYAPGNYMCNCSTCKTQFQGDKRAVQCEPCAIKMVQKQNIIDMMKGDEELGLYDEIQPEQIWNEEKKKGIKQLIQDHKKETLEEAAERLNPYVLNGRTPFKEGLYQGAKWHAERSYSEEDMQEMYNYGYNNYLPYEKAIEQFKKK